jgi:hypothetical protein
MLPVPGYVCSVCALLGISVLSHGHVCSTATCAAPGHFCSTAACTAPRRVCSTAACAVPGSGWPTASCAAPRRVCLQDPVCILYVSVDVFCAGPGRVCVRCTCTCLSTRAFVLHLDVSIYKSLCCKLFFYSRTH